MNLSQLYYFAKLSEMQHYAKAAKELYITQPSLSHAIKSLEAELGVSLVREGRASHEAHAARSRFCRTRQARLARDRQRGGSGAGVQRQVERYGEHRRHLHGAGRLFTHVVARLPCPIRANGEVQPVSGVLRRRWWRRSNATNTTWRSRPRFPTSPIYASSTWCPNQLVAFVALSNPIAHLKSVSLGDLRGRLVYTYRRGTP